MLTMVRSGNYSVVELVAVNKVKKSAPMWVQCYQLYGTAERF